MERKSVTVEYDILFILYKNVLGLINPTQYDLFPSNNYVKQWLHRKVI